MNLENFFRSESAKRAVEKFRDSHPSPAFSIALVRDGKVIASILKRMDIHTSSRIASMSKSFAASSLVMLRDEGKLDLHARLVDVLGSAALHPRWHNITIHQLLSMTTPIVTDNDWADRYLSSSNAQYSEFFKLEPVMASGETAPLMSYSNLAYMLAGRIISSVSGIDARDFINERLIRPLEMKNTFWENPSRSDENYLRGYRQIGQGWGEETKFTVDGDGAVFGGLWSSISDLAIWLDYLSSSTNSLLSRHYAPIQSDSFTSLATGETAIQYASYGYGLRTAIIGRRQFSGHSGALPGYGSAMRWETKSRIGLIAIANSTYCPVWNLVRDLLAAEDLPTEDENTDHPEIEDVCSRLKAVIQHWPRDKDTALFSPNLYPDLSFEKVDAEFSALAALCKNTRSRPLSFQEGEITFIGENSTHTLVFTIAPVKPLAIQRLMFKTDLVSARPR